MICSCAAPVSLQHPSGAAHYHERLLRAVFGMLNLPERFDIRCVVSFFKSHSKISANQKEGEGQATRCRFKGETQQNNSFTVSPTFNLVLLSMAKAEESNSQRSFRDVQKLPITCELLQQKCAFKKKKGLRGITCAIWPPPVTAHVNHGREHRQTELKLLLLNTCSPFRPHIQWLCPSPESLLFFSWGLQAFEVSDEANCAASGPAPGSPCTERSRKSICREGAV